jgi:hypothetical protein
MRRNNGCGSDDGGRPSNGTNLVVFVILLGYAGMRSGRWREIAIVTVEGDRINRCEVFDEADLDAALARFEELHPQAPRLENAATRVSERMDAYYFVRDWDAMTEILADGRERRCLTYFAARDWDALAEMLSDDISRMIVGTS